MNLLVFLLLFAVRLTSVFVVKTFFVPDEYWQSLEVAHKLTFGYGYLTWEWVQGVRSYVYPLAISGIFKLLALFNMDSAWLLVLLPRILQATLSAYSDYRFFVWSGKKKWAIFFITVPWFWFYIGSRTLSNTLETSLTTIALSYFPWYGEGWAYLWPAALCCYLRPTAALIWLPLVIRHLLNSQLPWPELIFKHLFNIGFVVGAICVGIDSWMHGGLLITPYAFLKYNILNDIASFYGTHPWYWYFIIGLPSLMGVNIVPFAIGAWKTFSHKDVYPVRKYLLFIILLTLCALSTIGHKEIRFISILLPLCLYITTDQLTIYSFKATRLRLWFIAGGLLLGNAIPAWYFSTIHQKGQLEVIDKLHDIAMEYRDEYNRTASVLFLMPCHSTPYYSHIHQNVTMRFLTCEHNLKLVANKDEAEEFFAAPEHWLRANIPFYPRTAQPSHVVLYEPTAEQIPMFLKGYKQLYKISNADENNNMDSIYALLKRVHLITETDLERRGKNILVFQRLHTGEENKFNRKEYQDENDESLKLPKLVESNEDTFYGQDEFATENDFFN